VTRRSDPNPVHGVFDSITPLHLPSHPGARRIYVDGGAGMTLSFTPRAGLPSWWVGGWSTDEAKLKHVNEAAFVETIKAAPDAPYCLNVEHWPYAIAWQTENAVAAGLRKLIHLLMLAHEAAPARSIGLYRSVWENTQNGKASFRRVNDRIAESGLYDAIDWQGVRGYGSAVDVAIGVCEAKRLTPDKPVLVFFAPHNTLDQIKAAKDAGADGAICWEWTGFKPLTPAQAKFCDDVLSVFGNT
jgi:hypothetical protein